jgi:large subunit ribosomal protein L9
MAAKVILREDVANLGKRGDICEVSDGYARNYLLPKGLAMTANDGAITQAGSMRRARDVRDAQERGEAETVASRLVPRTITVKAKAGPEGRLFGSVTAADIVEAVEAQTGIVLDRRKLLLAEPIKHTGTHSVAVKLHADVEFPVTVEVGP